MQRQVTHFELEAIDGDGQSPRTRVVPEADLEHALEKPRIVRRVAAIVGVVLAFAVAVGFAAILLLRAAQ